MSIDLFSLMLGVILGGFAGFYLGLASPFMKIYKDFKTALKKTENERYGK